MEVYVIEKGMYSDRHLELIAQHFRLLQLVNIDAKIRQLVI